MEALDLSDLSRAVVIGAAVALCYHAIVLVILARIESHLRKLAERK